MAKKDSSDFDGKTSGQEARSFDGELQKDANDFHVKDSQWVHARNAINNSNTGDVGRMGNEPANRLCIKIWQTPDPLNPLNGTGPLTIIGFIHLLDDKWAVYSTDNTNSEVGYFEENICRYTRIVNDKCLNFKTTNLIYGQSRENFDCTYSLYWADGLNPDRYLNIGDIKYAPFTQPWPNVPWVCTDGPPQYACNVETGAVTPCEVCTPVFPLSLVCDLTRLETLFRPICLQLFKGAEGGELVNGSYFAVGAYTVNGQRVTDYSIPSNIQPLFSHTGVGGSLRIKICNMDSDMFDEFELIVVSVIAQQTVARRIGIYSTKQEEIGLDIINPGQDETIPINLIPALNPIYETSDLMAKVNDYLIRVAPTGKFQFNYQPLANQIATKWVSVEYPEDYYINGGSNTGYMRDEVYSFFIRWVYKTGDKSASFHIPGRPKRISTLGPGTAALPQSSLPQGYELYSDGTVIPAPNGADDIEEDLSVTGPINLQTGTSAPDPEIWQQWNTAVEGQAITPYTLCDGGIVIAEGYMGYWESSERYPDYKPDIWNASSNNWSCLNPPNCVPPAWPYTSSRLSDYDLCGKYIRHHRFPDNDLTTNTSHFRCNGVPASTLSNPAVKHIRIMGVKFENIRPPVDNDGNLIPNIVGYEILRGSRVGNKSVIAKGIINNMWKYDLGIDNDTTGVTGLYQNYPYNDLHQDPFLSVTKTRNDSGNPHDNPSNYNQYPATDARRNIFSFHSPETNFTNPYLSSIEMKIYQDLDGRANMQFRYVDQHPRTVFIKDFGVVVALIAGVATALLATTGKQATERARRVNISNMPDTLSECEYTFRYNFNVTGYTNGSVNSSDSEKCDDSKEHPLATQGNSDAQQVNQTMESDEDSFFTGFLGSSENFREVGLRGRGYSNKDNSLIQAYDRFHRDTYDINQNIGNQQSPKYTYEYGAVDYIPETLYLFANIAGLQGGAVGSFLYYMTEGADIAWRAMYAFSSPQRHELQTVSHCLYDGCASRPFGQRRRRIINQAYIDNQVHTFTNQYRVNNLYRGRYVAMEISGTYNPPAVTDDTRVNSLLQDFCTSADDYENPEIDFQKTSSTYYTAIKQRLRNQYGQLDSIVQIPISCTISTCIPSGNLGGRNGLRTLPDGYEGLRLPPLSQCQNNLVEDGAFVSIIGLDTTASTDQWVMLPNGYWANDTVTLGTTTYTVAKNNGPGELIQPSTASTDLIQYLSPPHNNTVVGGALPNNAQINTFNFDIIEFPDDADYKLEVWLGNPVTNGVLVKTYTGGPTVFPHTVSITGNTPSTGLLDRLLFRVKTNSFVSPTKATAGFAFFSNRYTAGTASDQNDGYAQKFHNIWIPEFQNVQNDSKNNFSADALTQIRLDSYPFYDLYDGNNINGSEIVDGWPNFIQSGTCQAFTCDFGTKANNYITDIKCISRFTWNLNITARTVPRYRFYDFCTKGCPVIVGQYEFSTACDNPASNPTCATAVALYQSINGFPPGVLARCGDGGTNTPPSGIIGDACAVPGRIRMSLRRITSTQTPGTLGTLTTDSVFNGWIIDGSSQGGAAGSWYNLNPNPSTTSGFLNVPINATSVLINPDLIPGYDPNDRFIMVMETQYCQFNFIGTGVTLDMCVENPPISITNVCVDVQVPSAGAILGCMSQNAVNYNPNATQDDGCCQFTECVQGQPGSQNAVNTVTQYNLGPACGNISAYVHDSTLCQGSNPGTPVNVNFNSSTGVGYCFWPCTTDYGIQQIGNGTASCPTVTSFRSYPLFGGDIYIGRYTEKNSFFYFIDWMYGQPDRTEWDYLKYKMMPWPAFWYNSEAISISEITQSWLSFLTNPLSWFTGGAANLLYPSKYHVMDRPNLQIGLAIKLGYIYLFNSGVRDFFVESEYNVDLRDFGDEITQRHYQSKGPDSFTDIYGMFKSGVIRAGNYYKYDTSLSIAKTYYEYTPWSTIYPPFYDPNVAETCWRYLPQQLIYSLPASKSTIRDNWRIFLTDNTAVFRSKITTVKPIFKSGILVLFQADPPLMFQGTDQLETQLATGLVIGDGGLFTQPSQSLMNADDIYQFGSCQSKLSVVNTPVGTFWVSVEQGKIFQFSSGMAEISLVNLKWWLAQFLPFQLTKYFPNYQLVDNPVVGIGVQTVYDNTNNLLYFCKKDWKPKLDAAGNPLIKYDEELNEFYDEINGNGQAPTRVKVELGNTRYFDPASWTISYDVKTEGGSWISFHDWHPGLTSGTTNYFMTTKDNGIWMHNDRFDLYTNYYGIDYPFEIEYLVNTIQEVSTLRSIEYQLEVYQYSNNGYDRFHVLDYNFDEAIVYNTEQCSGLLKLNLTPKNNAPLITTFPQVNPTNIQILYSKEENKYRFNQFWDATKNRSEFKYDPALISPVNPTGLVYPPQPTAPAPGGDLFGPSTAQTIFNTAPNGYVKTLNAFNLLYTQKSQFDRKKFRHYTTNVMLRRLVSGNKKMLMSIANNKTLRSAR